MKIWVLLALSILVFTQGCGPENEASKETDDFEVINIEMDDKIFKIGEFTRVTEGMTYDEVVEVIGEPSSKVGSGLTWNTYDIGDGWFVDLLFLGEPSTLTAMRIVDYQNNRKFILMDDFDK